jgi:hypothetical protein
LAEGYAETGGRALARPPGGKKKRGRIRKTFGACRHRQAHDGELPGEVEIRAADPQAREKTPLVAVLAGRPLKSS